MIYARNYIITVNGLSRLVAGQSLDSIWPRICVDSSSN